MKPLTDYQFQRMMEKIKLMRRAGRVERYHTMPSLHTQTVGEHTFGVLAIMNIIYYPVPERMWRTALCHDVPEAITGDIPATAKWRHTKLEKALKEAESGIVDEFNLDVLLDPSADGNYERKIIKYCDMMELVLFALEEVDMGNKLMTVVAANGLKAIEQRDLANVTEEAKLLTAFAARKLASYGPTDDTNFLNGWPLYE